MSDFIEVQFDKVEPKLVGRAIAVKDRIREIKDSVEDNFLDLCDLLLEAQENAYHVVWGYGQFGQWVEQGSELDLSARTAYYYINIAKKIKTLGLSREEIKQAKISKLKEIFTLDPAKHGDEMKALVKEAATEPLDVVRERVQDLHSEDGEERKAYMTLKFDATVKQTVQEAFELARLNYGDVDLGNGEFGEASDSQCMELICASYLQDANNRPEELAA